MHRHFDSGHYWSALISYLVLAEQGCEVACANAAWMLQRGIGLGGQQAMGLAAQLLERCVGRCGGLLDAAGRCCGLLGAAGACWVCIAKSLDGRLGFCTFQHWLVHIWLTRMARARPFVLHIL